MITPYIIITTIVLGFWIRAGVLYIRMKKAQKDYTEIQRKNNMLN